MTCPYCGVTVTSIMVESRQTMIVQDEVVFNDTGDPEYIGSDSDQFDQVEDLIGCYCPICEQMICKTLKEAKTLMSPCSVRN